jgi:DNA gyrase subunit B
MLGSAEVATLITALGTGIGADDFDLARLRYHRVIIMTDADVDGSHIRTLLLTFFYRQMPELLTHGHIYIAQPPLYKIKRGKEERYLKDEPELQACLLEAALDGALLRPAPQAAPLTGEPLAALCRDYLAVEADTRRLSRRYDERLLRRLIYLPGLSPEVLADAAEVERFARALQASLAEGNGAARYDVSMGLNSHAAGHEILVTRSEHGSVSTSRLDAEFVGSGEYRALRALGERLTGLVQPGATAQRGERVQPVAGFEQALEWLMEEARRGQSVQRYKGLGEMNPEQLWETTMDPGTRRLLKVGIEDGVAADAVFTTLMGDQVEPRREFIEKNALFVANLDV